MCCNKILGMCLIVTLAFVFGCSKQEKTSAMKKSAEIPDISKTSPKNSDTADIFKEFYSDDTSQKSNAKKPVNKSAKADAKNRTFSPAATGASAAEFSEHGRYVVQVSCVKSRAFAKKMAEGLKEKGFPAYVAEVESPTPNLSGEYYRVRIGGFTAYSAAKAFGENSLVQTGLQYWVDKKSNDKIGIEGSGLGAGSSTASPTSSYESAPQPASSWSASPSPTPSSSAQVPASSSGSPSSAASSSAPSPAPATPAVESPSPAAAPDKAPAASAKPSNAPAETTAVAPASAPKAQPSAQASPAKPSAAPATTATEASPKSNSPGTGANEWGSDTSASGSGW
jgi:hypothetical protein